MSARIEELRKQRDAANAESDNAQCCVIGMARLLADDWRKGEAPCKFALDLLAQLVDDFLAAQAESLKACEAVTAAYDAEVRS